jgi:hypothetical protein
MGEIYTAVVYRTYTFGLMGKIYTAVVYWASKAGIME